MSFDLLHVLLCQLFGFFDHRIKHSYKNKRKHEHSHIPKIIHLRHYVKFRHNPAQCAYSPENY